MKLTLNLPLIAVQVALGLAASNAFTSPTSGSTVNAGDTLNVAWTNAAGSSVTLVLVNGDPSNLKTVATIGDNIPNQGSVAWTLPTDLANGDYALEIINNEDHDDVNYSPRFTVTGGADPATQSSESTETSATASAVSSDERSETVTTGADATSDSDIPTSTPTVSIVPVAARLGDLNDTAVNSTAPVGNTTVAAQNTTTGALLNTTAAPMNTTTPLVNTTAAAPITSVAPNTSFAAPNTTVAPNTTTSLLNTTTPRTSTHTPTTKSLSSRILSTSSISSTLEANHGNLAGLSMAMIAGAMGAAMALL